MAIVIPSKNIYNKENKKILDNIIENISISANEVTIKGEKNSTLFNGDGSIDAFLYDYKNTDLIKEESYWGTPSNSILDELYNFNEDTGNEASFYYNLGFVIIRPTYLRFKVKDGISDINFPQYKNNDKVVAVEYPEFKYDLYKADGSVTNFDIKYGDKGKEGDYINGRVGSYFSGAKFSNIQTTYGEEESIQDKIKDKMSVTYISKGYGERQDVEIKATAEDKDNTTNLEKIKLSLVDFDNITKVYTTTNEIYFLVELEIITITKNGYYPSTDSNNAFNIQTAPAEEKNISPNGKDIIGSCTKYKANNISVRVYGEQIKTNLSETNIILGKQNSKKQYAIEANELLQTSNYYLHKNNPILVKIGSAYVVEGKNGYMLRTDATNLYEGLSFYSNGNKFEIVDKGYDYYGVVPYTQGIWDNMNGKEVEIIVSTNSIQRYENTKNQYQGGKETATILCSISDYYEYEDSTKKIISIDNSTDKMIFEIGDEVIPMVYGADGKDSPMSYYKNKATIFQILGTKLYYDGAVWQELSLQESGIKYLPEEPEEPEYPEEPEEPDEPIVQQLTPPIIDIVGDMLHILDYDDKTDEFLIFVDHVEKLIIGKDENPYNLSNLNLSVGTYEITVKSRTDLPNFLDSDESNSEIYKVVSSTGYLLSGAWRFRELINTEGGIYSGIEFIDFTSLGDTSQYFKTISVIDGDVRIMYSNEIVYNTESIGPDDPAQFYGWLSDDYRGIIFLGEQEVSEGFYYWFINNAEQIQ